MGVSSSKKSNEVLPSLEIKEIEFIFQRHATTCSNILYQTLESSPLFRSKMSENTDISNIGVQQCLQTADFLSRCKKFNKDIIFSEANTIQEILSDKEFPDKNTITIFCCSELIRTQETLFLSFLKYMPDYLKKQKILILPWLNEKKEPLPKKLNKENYPNTPQKTKEKWKQFTEKMSNLTPEFAANLGRNNLELNLQFNFDDIFDYENVQNIKTKNRMPIPEDFLSNLPSIISKYIKKYKLHGNRIRLICVTHLKTGENLIKYLIPNNNFKLQQFLNCEIIKLPPYNLEARKILDLKNFANHRLFPVGFYSHYIQKKVEMINKRKKIYIYPYYILNFSELKIFFILADILTQKIQTFSKQLETIPEEPLQNFLGLSGEEYNERLKIYHNIFEKLVEFMNKGNYYYDYENLKKQMRTIPNNSTVHEYFNDSEKSLDKLHEYLFDFCKNKLRNYKPRLLGKIK